MPARATDEGAYLWRGSVALRAERTARHRRMRSVVLVLAVFAYALLQIRISTEIAERGSRVTQLSREMARLQEEIKIARARLDRVQIYPDLLEPAQAAGFAPGGTHRVIWSSEESQAAEADLWAEVRGELKRGTDVLLPQAIAREIRPPERGRAQRP